MKIRITVSTELHYPQTSIKKGDERIVEIEVPPAQAAEILAARESLPDHIGTEHLLTTLELINDDGHVITTDERVKARA